MATLFGSNIDDILNGTVSNDSIFGFDGNDVLNGGDGDDILDGGNGNDTLTGADGNDLFRGSGGNDTVNGGNGNDTADYSQLNTSITLRPTGVLNKGVFGTDQLVGIETIIANSNVANNTIDASTAAGASITVNLQTQSLAVNGVPGVGPFTVVNFDDVKGTASADIIIGNNAANKLIGGAGDDALYGEGGDDRLIGEDGNDTLVDGDGNDIISGGNGNDTIVVGTGNNSIDGGAGIDIVNYINSADPMRIDLLNRTTTSFTNLSRRDTLLNIENAVGTTGNDTFVGNASNNTFVGDRGNDTFISSTGIDTFEGGEGLDTADYSNLGKSITLLTQGELLKGTAGRDKLIGVERIVGAVSQANAIDASAATGNVSIVADLINNRLTVNNVPNLAPFTVENFTQVTGTINADTIFGNNLNNVLSGNGGNDTILGGGGSDTIYGNDGDDTLNGGSGADRFVFNSQFEGIDLIKDFNRVEGDKIQVSQVGFGASFLGQFSYNSITGALFFQSNQFATIENKPVDFTASLDIVLV